MNRGESYGAGVSGKWSVLSARLLPAFACPLWE